MATKKTKAPVNPLTLGNKVFIRTVTMYHVGKIVLLDKDMIVLDEASWVADTGRLGVMLKTGALNEVEKAVGTVAIGRGAVIDVYHWGHALPTESK